MSLYHAEIMNTFYLLKKFLIKMISTETTNTFWSILTLVLELNCLAKSSMVFSPLDGTRSQNLIFCPLFLEALKDKASSK